MSKQDDGGPMFRMNAEGQARCSSSGQVFDLYCDISGNFTLRDYFAAEAVVGLIAKGEHWVVDASKCPTSKCVNPRSLIPLSPLPKVTDYPRVARMAYAIADAMLAARKETP
jgi:hypothetical protein